MKWKKIAKTIFQFSLSLTLYGMLCWEQIRNSLISSHKVLIDDNFAWDKKWNWRSWSSGKKTFQYSRQLRNEYNRMLRCFSAVLLCWCLFLLASRVGRCRPNVGILGNKLCARINLGQWWFTFCGKPLRRTISCGHSCATHLVQSEFPVSDIQAVIVIKEQMYAKVNVFLQCTSTFYMHVRLLGSV